MNGIVRFNIYLGIELQLFNGIVYGGAQTIAVHRFYQEVISSEAHGLAYIVKIIISAQNNDMTAQPFSLNCFD